MRTLPDLPLMSADALEADRREDHARIEVHDPKIERAFLEKVQAFSQAQPRVGRAKLLGFFHLANLEAATAISFHVDASGVMTLSIVATATAD